MNCAPNIQMKEKKNITKGIKMRNALERTLHTAYNIMNRCFMCMVYRMKSHGKAALIVRFLCITLSRNAIDRENRLSQR